MRLATPLALVGALLLAPAPAAQSLATDCENGTAGQYRCQAIDLLSVLSHPQMGGSTGNDIWGWTDPASGREFALVGQTDGTAFVEVTAPEAPVFLGRLPTHTSATWWRDIKVYRDHAFVVSEAGGHGMQVFDLKRLLNVASPPETFTEDAHYDQVSSVHNLAINEDTGFAYLVGSGYSQASGLPDGCESGARRGHHVVNIQEPLNPTFETCFSDTGSSRRGYTHDTQCILYSGPDADYAGREICAASNEDVVSFFDATDKQDVKLVGQGVYPNEAYTHQGWFTEDRRFFLVGDELDENNFGGPTRTFVFDVSDLDNPVYLDAYTFPEGVIDHNLYVRGRYAYQSNYTTGLRIVDLQPLLSGGGMPVEVAYFDTYPQNDAKGSFDGQWSNYPFFPSGVIIANDGNNGLFVLRNNLAGATSTVRPPSATAARFDVFPNPTAGDVTFEMTVGEAQRLRVAVYDLLGRRVQTVFDGRLAAGSKQPVKADLSELSAGLYLVRFEGERTAETRRLVVAH